MNIALRWFLSPKIRQACDMRRHALRLLNHQRDILSPQAIDAVNAAVRQIEASLKSAAGDDVLAKDMADLEKAANKWIKPFPNSEWRENVEVFLVAIVVAMSVRTFFLQPFKIPTGSMQPTLFGVTDEDLRDKPDFQMPGFFQKTWEWMVYGRTYHELMRAPDDGEVVQVDPLQHVCLFFNKQRILVQYNGASTSTPLDVWFGPDEQFELHSGLIKRTPSGEPYRQTTFHKGEPILRFVETTGDHLFVDRVTYNFRHPKRGEIVVFKTAGIPGIANQDQFYIKRLIALGGERVSIGEDRHVRINGVRLDASTPHFENVYGFDPNTPPRENQYSGHTLAKNFSSPLIEYQVPLKSCLVFGDNTMNSADSRYWGDMPEKNIIGTSWFVYWPISSRFGWGQR